MRQRAIAIAAGDMAMVDMAKKPMNIKTTATAIKWRKHHSEST